jgi:hypothetical protein
MIVMLKTQGLQNLDAVRAFLAGTQTLGFEAPGREATYEWIAGELRRFGYLRLSKPDKGLVRRYLEKVTGRSRAQVTRLITQFRNTGRIRDRRGPPAKPFAQRYTAADVRLLAEVDALLGTLSGPTTRKLCERAYTVFGDARYAPAWPGSPTATSTTSARPSPISACAAPWTRPAPCRSPSANGASPGRTAAPASCASIPSIKATSTVGRKGRSLWSHNGRFQPPST